VTPPPSDADWLAAAARLSLRGTPASRPNPAVGCIIVNGAAVVGRGWTRAGGRPHAEAAALETADAKARGATVYVTLEPCAHRSERGPACADLLVEAAPARVVIGIEDPDQRTAGAGTARLRAAGIEVVYRESEAARRSLSPYLTRHRYGRPMVTLKLAMSLDGRIALPDGRSRWITGETARAHCHIQRAMHDAILVGGKTWRADAPRLDVRLPGLERRSPERWVLTSKPVEGAQAIAAPGDIAGSDAMSLYVEGGAQAAAAFLAEDLVDRLDIYRAPIVIGDGLPAIGDIGLGELAEAHDRWTLRERRQLGSDGYESYERRRN